jgi:hypothetical protein
VFHGGPGWSWSQSFQYLIDGRGAYNSAETHCLGEYFAGHLQSSADVILENAVFDGHSCNFTFEQYCEMLKVAFTDIASTEEEVLETWKVRVIGQGITENAKNQVLGTTTLKATFDKAVNFINQFLDEKTSFGSSANKGNCVCNVLSASTGRGNQGGNHGCCRGGHGCHSGCGGRGSGGCGRGKGHRGRKRKGYRLMLSSGRVGYTKLGRSAERM